MIEVATSKINRLHGARYIHNNTLTRVSQQQLSIKIGRERKAAIAGRCIRDNGEQNKSERRLSKTNSCHFIHRLYFGYAQSTQNQHYGLIQYLLVLHCDNGDEACVWEE